MIRALPRVGLQLWIVLFLVFFGAEVIHLEPGLRILTQVLYGVPLAMGAALWLRGPRDRLDLAVMAALGAYLVVALASGDRMESLGSLGLVTAYAAWFLLMRRAAATDLRGTVVVGAATGLAVTLGLNAYLLIEEKATWFARFGSAPFEGLHTFPWESVNALPVLVLLAVPFVFWAPPGAVRTAVASVVGFSAVVVVPLSLGRAGWLGLAVAAGILGFTFARGHADRRRLLLGGVAAAAVVVLGLAVVVPRFVTALHDSGRLLLWEQGWNLFGAAPFLGSGPGTYSWVRLEAPPPMADVVAVRLVHNVPLQTLIEGGIVLALVLAGVVAAWALSLRRVSPTRWGDTVALASLTGFGAALILDDFSYLPALTLTAITLAGFLAPVGGAPVAGWLRWTLPATLAVAAAVALPFVVAVDGARAAAQAGRTAMVEERHEDAVDAFQQATAAHPQNGGYWLGLGMAHAYAGADAEAADAYARATEAAPGDPRGYGGLAHFEPESEAITLLGAAADRTTGDPQYAIRLGSALAANGDVEGAAQAWAEALVLQPSLVHALSYEEAGLSADAVIAEALARLEARPFPGPPENDQRIWDLGLASGSLPADAGAGWRAVASAQSGDLDAARALAEAAVAEAPYDARGYQARAAVAAYACDAQAEAAALARERLARGAYEEAAPRPRSRREFIYRQASLGPSQPPGAGLYAELDRWPWPLVDRPECP